MPDPTRLNIDKLTLKVSGLSEERSRHLARLVSQGLGAVDLTGTETRRVDSLRVSVPSGGSGAAGGAPRGDDPAELTAMARRVVAEVLRQLGRSL